MAVFVDKLGSDTFPYDTWAKAAHDLQDGIDRGIAADLPVLVAEGTYTPTQAKFPATGGPEAETFLIDPGSTSLSIHGGFRGNSVGMPNTDPDMPDGSFNRTILRGKTGAADRHHVITVIDVNSISSNTTVTIDGFRVKTGIADGTDSANFEDVGGGLLVANPGDEDFGRVIIENCWFDNNWASEKGGAVYFGPETVGSQNQHQVRRCVFTNNSAVEGGAMFISRDSGAYLGNVEFRNNGTGAVSGSPRAARGGGLFLEDLTCLFVVANGVFFGNGADIAGGAMYLEVQSNADVGEFGLANDRREIGNCTFVQNTVRPQATGAGGVHVAVGGSGGAPASSDFYLKVHNSIGWENASGGHAGGYVDVKSEVGDNLTVEVSHSNFTSAGSLVLFGGTQTSLTYLDPGFVNLATGNLHLRNGLGSAGGGQPISPLIDIGLDMLLDSKDEADVDMDNNVNGPVLTLDLELESREIDYPGVGGSEEVDLGAYETTYPFSQN